MNYGGRPFRGPGPYGGGPWGGPGPSRPPFQQRPFPPSPFQQPPHRQQYQQQYGPPHTQPPPTSYPQRLPPSHTASHSNPGPPMQAQHHMRPPRNSPTPASASSGDTEKVPFVGYEATVYIGMENAPAEFGLELRLSGEKGANLDYLSQATKAKVVLWGHGTGINERKPLHLYIVHDTLKGKEEAVSLANHLVRTVKDELCDWRKEQDLLKHRKTSHKRRSRSPRSRSPLSDAEPPDEKRSRRTMRGRSPVERDEKHHRSSDPKAGPAEAKQADNSQHIALATDGQPLYKVLLLTDSRGPGFLDELKYEDLSIRIIPISGATIESLTAEALCYKLQEFDLVILSVGIWNITYKNPSTNIVCLRRREPAAIANILRLSLEASTSRLIMHCKHLAYTDICGLKFNCINGPIVGPNEDPTPYALPIVTSNDPLDAAKVPEDPQAILDDSIILVNRVIKLHNKTNCLSTPYISQVIHKCIGNSKVQHKYSHLPDGVHPCPDTKLKIEKALIKYIYKIKELGFRHPPIKNPFYGMTHSNY